MKKIFIILVGLTIISSPTYGGDGKGFKDKINEPGRIKDTDNITYDVPIIFEPDGDKVCITLYDAKSGNITRDRDCRPKEPGQPIQLLGTLDGKCDKYHTGANLGPYCGTTTGGPLSYVWCKDKDYSESDPVVHAEIYYGPAGLYHIDNLTTNNSSEDPC